MRGSHRWTADSAVFDETNLISAGGLVPVMELAERAGLSDLLDEQVRFPVTVSGPGLRTRPGS